MPVINSHRLKSEKLVSDRFLPVAKSEVMYVTKLLGNLGVKSRDSKTIFLGRLGVRTRC